MATKSHIDSNLRTSLLNTAASLLGEREELRARMAEIDVQLSAIETLTGEGLVPSEPAVRADIAPPPPAQPETWIQFVTRQLSGINGGMTGKQLIAAIKASPDFSMRFARSPNSYYNALQRLDGLGITTKQGRTIYLKETWDRIAAGKIVDETEVDDVGGMPSFITKVLSDSKYTMSPAEVVAALREIPEAAAKMDANKQAAYATLSRMAGLGMISKDEDGRYRVRPDQPSRTPSLQLVEGGANDVG